MCISKNELEAKVAEYRKYRAIKEEAEEILKSLEFEMKEYLTDNGIDEARVADGKISCKEVSRKGSLDEELMALDGIDVESFRKPSTTYKRFTLK